MRGGGSQARLFLAAVLSFCCGKAAAPPPDPRELEFPGTAAVRLSPARPGEWLLLFETLQPQLLVTTPIRTAGLLSTGGKIARTYEAPDGNAPGTHAPVFSDAFLVVGALDLL